MSIALSSRPTHPWLRRIHVAIIPGSMSPLLERVTSGLTHFFRIHGNQVQTTPDADTDVILTTARFGESIRWRDALFFTARRRFGLSHAPTIYTLLQITLTRFRELLTHFRGALEKGSPDPADFSFPGLAPQAHMVLFEQGRRGGPILSLERLSQAQAKCIRIILLVGDEQPLAAYHFDLAGAHPQSSAEDIETFYQDIVLRVATSASTTEVNQHQVVGDPITRATWQNLSTPAAMATAGQQLGKRQFFTQMVRIADIVQVPVVSGAIASQYSEGCFSTWDASLQALVSTVTGSARPVDKGNITDDDLAVIVGVRPDSQGALVRHVEGIKNDPPSSEAVELMGMDAGLPTISLDLGDDTPAQVPVVRSKLHGHRGVSAFHPRHVEYAPLDLPYYHYPVSCATDAQARGIKDAFSRSEALNNPDDPRQVVFTILPGHGVVIVEKWAPGKAPFQLLWEFMDAGYLEVTNLIPQGLLSYLPGPDGRMHLEFREDDLL